MGDQSLGEKDRRRQHPRFQAGNLDRNVSLIAKLKTLAVRENCTPAQLALAWVLARRPFIVPIPGTSHRKWLEQNAAAASLDLSAATIAALDSAFPLGAASGPRYPEAQLARLGV